VRRFIAALALIAVAVGLFAGMSQAQESAGESTEAPTIVRSIDSRSAPDAVMGIMTAGDIGELTMTQDGQNLEIASLQRELGVCDQEVKLAAQKRRQQGVGVP
jgi:hypothetical protein